jgi:hypothetical protein
VPIALTSASFAAKRIARNRTGSLARGSWASSSSRRMRWAKRATPKRWQAAAIRATSQRSVPIP